MALICMCIIYFTLHLLILLIIVIIFKLIDVILDVFVLVRGARKIESNLFVSFEPTKLLKIFINFKTL